MDVTAKNLGSRIKELRLSQKYTQEQLAENSNLHVSYIGIIERGEKNISIKALNDILISLDVSLVDFFKPFDNDSSTSSIEDTDLYELILLPLQSLSNDDRNKVLEIIKLAISLNK